MAGADWADVEITRACGKAPSLDSRETRASGVMVTHEATPGRVFEAAWGVAVWPARYVFMVVIRTGSRIEQRWTIAFGVKPRPKPHHIGRTNYGKANCGRRAVRATKLAGCACWPGQEECFEVGVRDT